MEAHAFIEIMLRFVRGIGIEIREIELADDTLLPGLDIRYGAVVVDRARLKYPGDILHEAGHVAVSSAEERAAPTLSPTPGDEMTAIAWSYAAALHLDVPLQVLFHPDGYKGGSQAFISNFSAGRYLGVPLLHCYDMAIEPRQAKPGGPLPYPHMLRWVR